MLIALIDNMHVHYMYLNFCTLMDSFSKCKNKKITGGMAHYTFKKFLIQISCCTSVPEYCLANEAGFDSAAFWVFKNDMTSMVE